MERDGGTMRGRGRAALAAGLAVLLAANQTPLSGADPDEPIVVTGTRLTPERARQRAVEFVRLTGVATGRRPAARWEDPVCPRVAGLAGDLAALVEARLRSVAAAAGIDVAAEPCRPNIAIVFAADGAATVRGIDRRSPGRLAALPEQARVALREGTAPVRWWYATDTRTPHGMSSNSNSGPYVKIDGAEGGGPAISGVPALQHYTSSMVSTQAQRVLTSATVVIDANRAEGLPLNAVAAYAAFVAFAEIRPSESTPAGSILALFEGPEAPLALTEQDMAFLRALYRLPLDREARRHRGILVREMVEAATGG